MNIWALNKHFIILVLDKDDHVIDSRSVQLKTGTIAEHNRLAKRLKDWAFRNYPRMVGATFINQYLEQPNAKIHC